MPSPRSTKHLTLLAADVLPPAGFALPANTPVLDALLRRSRTLVGQPQSLEEALLHAFGLDPAANIVAPLTKLADVDTPGGTPGGTLREQAWLRADPVHLAISRDNAQLFDSHVVNPTADEMAAVAETINQHFARDGIVVTFPDPARGYIATDANNLPQSTPLWKMGGANVFDNLPLSKTRTNWRAVSNEIQMLLHEHPVNVRRAEVGTPAINALWIWGGGTLNQAIEANDSALEPPMFTNVVARLVLARGLGIAHQLPVAALPPALDVNALGERSLVVLHTATREVRAQSRETWPDEVAAIERDWIAPAVVAFDAGQLDRLTILLPGESASLVLEVYREGVTAKLMSLVRAKKRLAEYA